MIQAGSLPRILLAVVATLGAGSCDTSPVASIPRSQPTLIVIVSPDRATIEVDATVQLRATVRNVAGETVPGHAVTWLSENPAVATVSPDGQVRGVAPGVTSIVAMSDDRAGLASIAVQLQFRLPLPGGHDWLLVAETGSPANTCPRGEGGLRFGGGYECVHALESRYALDFADTTAAAGWASDVPVLVAAPGTVRDVCLEVGSEATCGPLGNYVSVLHPGGFLTIYGHLRAGSVVVHRKTAIASGERIGVMGRSGASPGTQVHFEVRYNTMGANAAGILDEFVLDGRRLIDYKVGLGSPAYYPSTNRPRSEVQTPAL